MNLDQRIVAFVALGDVLRSFISHESSEENPSFTILNEAIEKAGVLNGWFTRESVTHALGAWGDLLRSETLEKWLAPYASKLALSEPDRNVAVIMAGNIPLVGFHDFLSVLISGNKFVGRLSSDDPELLPALAKILIQSDTGWGEKIFFTKEKLTAYDAVIATGSNNSAIYFNYYFSKVPHIIRKNRNGVAVLTGEEDDKELSGLTNDIFLYYGLGCRNVTKLYFPEGYDVQPLFAAFRRYLNYCQHHKWMNNHDYYRSIFLLNQVPAMDNGFLLLTENKLIASPPAVLYFEYYQDLENLIDQLSLQMDEIQVIVSRKDIRGMSCLPGQAQSPGLADYADGVDTMKFLSDLVK
jgi:hypothetical protein